MAINDLFNQPIQVINVGSPSFNEDYETQRVEYVNLTWKPAANGSKELLNALDLLEQYKEEIDQANQQMIQQVKSAQGTLVGIKPALEVIPGMTKTTILHAGPPIVWDDMVGPMRGAIIGALLYEGLAQTEKEAELLAASGNITFSPAHEHNTVGPMAGIVSASMPVHIIFNPTHNNYAYCTINEGLGKVLRYGANSTEVLKKLKWIETVFSKVLGDALELSPGIDVKSLISQALHMGDEGHNRNKAASSLFLREVTEYILKTEHSLSDKMDTILFIKNNDHYFLNLSMPFCKVALDAGRDVAKSSVLTVMSRNGNQFGVQVSSSEKWFTGQANYVQGLLFPGFTQDDAARDIGDSSITETMGIGGFAMAGAPAIIQFVGGNVQDAFHYSIEMNEITVSTNPVFTLPTLDFMPTAIGIDIRLVVESGILPIINTGMAHKDPGVGQVGAGLVHPPFECFEKALLDFAKQFKKEE